MTKKQRTLIITGLATAMINSTGKFDLNVLADTGCSSVIVTCGNCNSVSSSPGLSHSCTNIGCFDVSDGASSGSGSGGGGGCSYTSCSCGSGCANTCSGVCRDDCSGCRDKCTTSVRWIVLLVRECYFSSLEKRRIALTQGRYSNLFYKNKIGRRRVA